MRSEQELNRQKIKKYWRLGRARQGFDWELNQGPSIQIIALNCLARPNLRALRLGWTKQALKSIPLSYQTPVLISFHHSILKLKPLPQTLIKIIPFPAIKLGWRELRRHSRYNKAYSGSMSQHRRRIWDSGINYGKVSGQMGTTISHAFSQMPFKKALGLIYILTVLTGIYYHDIHYNGKVLPR